MLVTARSSTDLAFHPHVFSTSWTEDFLTSTMKINTNDFTTCFEGHAIQGLEGTLPYCVYRLEANLKTSGVIRNDKKTITWFRSEIRGDIDKGLRTSELILIIHIIKLINGTRIYY